MVNEKLLQTLQSQTAQLESEKDRAIAEAVAENERAVVVPEQQRLNAEMTEKLKALNAEYAERDAAIRKEYANQSSEFAERQKAAITLKVSSEYDNVIGKIKALYSVE